MFMIGEDWKLFTPKLFVAAPEAVAVTLFMVGEDEELNTPLLFDAAPEAVAVTF